MNEEQKPDSEIQQGSQSLNQSEQPIAENNTVDDDLSAVSNEQENQRNITQLPSHTIEIVNKSTREVIY